MTMTVEPPFKPPAIDLRDSTVSRWEFNRWTNLTYLFLVVAKLILAVVVFPLLFLVIPFSVFWAVGMYAGHTLVAGFGCVFLVVFLVALARMLYERYWAGSHHNAVLERIIRFLLFLTVPIAAYVVSGFEMLDKHPHLLSEWMHYYGSLLTGGLVNYLVGDVPVIGTPSPTSKAVASVLYGLFYITIISTILKFIEYLNPKEVRIEALFDLYLPMLSPVFWWETFELKETGWLQERSDQSRQTDTLRTYKRAMLVQVGGYSYPFCQLRHYLTVPWTGLFSLIFFGKRLRIATVYKEDGEWLIREQIGEYARDWHKFVDGMASMIDFATRHIRYAEHGVTLRFSDSDFFGQSIILSEPKRKGEWVQYTWNVWGLRQGDQEVQKKGQMKTDFFLDMLDVKQIPMKIYVQVIETAVSVSIKHLENSFEEQQEQPSEPSSP